MKQYILLCRPRFEVALVEIEDDNIQRAQRRALELAPSDPASWALAPFDGQNYHPHVERCLPEPAAEISMYLGEFEKTAAGVRALVQDEDTRYLLLKADLCDGEGKVLRQPLMLELSPILEHDLCGDWLEAFEAYREKALEAAKAGLPSATGPRDPDQVLPFPKSDKDNDDT